MTGADATRPGDVLRIRNGKSVEVLNTDAEGRLILADALSLASEAEPDAIVDLATLTGACMVALGPSIAGLMGDGEWISQVREAADRAGERVWPLPLPPDYRKQLDSPVADMKNIGGQYGGSLTAGLFLKEFVADGIPWAHLDIAGPAFLDAEDGENPKGATGFGVRLLVELARSFEKPAAQN
jgi:leucyl aminopeptidase